MFEVTLTHYLILAAALFSLGVFCLLTRQNAIGLLIGIELIVNAANINFVVFSKYRGSLDGQLFAIFSIVLAAITAAVSLSIVFAVYRNFNKSIEVDDVSILKE